MAPQITCTRCADWVLAPFKGAQLQLGRLPSRWFQLLQLTQGPLFGMHDPVKSRNGQNSHIFVISGSTRTLSSMTVMHHRNNSSFTEHKCRSVTVAIIHSDNRTLLLQRVVTSNRPLYSFCEIFGLSVSCVIASCAALKAFLITALSIEIRTAWRFEFMSQISHPPPQTSNSQLDTRQSNR